MIENCSDMRVCMNSGVNAVKCITREALNIRLGKSHCNFNSTFFITKYSLQ